MVESEVEGLNVLCSFCKKPAVNKRVKCTNCSTVCHNSCCNKKTKKCCEKQCYVEDNQSEINEVIRAPDDSIGKTILDENNLLKGINQDLRENIQLLKGKIENLQLENSKLRGQASKDHGNGSSILEEKFINIINETVKANIEKSMKLIVGKINNLDTKINIVSKDGSEKVCTIQENSKSAIKQKTEIRNNNVEISKQLNTRSPKQTSSHSTSLPTQKTNEYSHSQNSLEGHQRRLMNEIINLDRTDANEPNRNNKPNNDDPDKDWQIQKRKRRGRQNIGQSDDTDIKFKGARPKAWMYIYRVSQEVTEEDIKDFLEKKTGDKNGNFIVNDLKESGRTKSYMVAADFKYKDDMYESSFWPKGVNYRRFDFNKHHEKHNTRNIITTENENRPNSFLEVGQ